MELTNPRYRWIILAIAGLLIAGLVLLALGPGRGLRQDIASMDEDLDEQVALTARQVELTAAMLDTVRQQLEEAVRGRRIARRTEQRTVELLETSQELLETGRRLETYVEESTAIARQSLAIHQEMLQHIREINQSMPTTGLGGSPGLDDIPAAAPGLPDRRDSGAGRPVGGGSPLPATP